MAANGEAPLACFVGCCLWDFRSLWFLHNGQPVGFLDDFGAAAQSERSCQRIQSRGLCHRKSDLPGLQFDGLAQLCELFPCAG